PGRWRLWRCDGCKYGGDDGDFNVGMEVVALAVGWRGGGCGCRRLVAGKSSEVVAAPDGEEREKRLG
nr:hypothetical protein [Tanacetum cinerariifolium]